MLGVFCCVLIWDLALTLIRRVRRGVSRNGFSAELAHHRTDIDNLAVSLFNHRGNDSLRHDKWCVEVNVGSI